MASSNETSIAKLYRWNKEAAEHLKDNQLTSAIEQMKESLEHQIYNFEKLIANLAAIQLIPGIYDILKCEQCQLINFALTLSCESLILDELSINGEKELGDRVNLAFTFAIMASTKKDYTAVNYQFEESYSNFTLMHFMTDHGRDKFQAQLKDKSPGTNISSLMSKQKIDPIKQIMALAGSKMEKLARQESETEDGWGNDFQSSFLDSALVTLFGEYDIHDLIMVVEIRRMYAVLIQHLVYESKAGGIHLPDLASAVPDLFEGVYQFLIDKIFALFNDSFLSSCDNEPDVLDYEMVDAWFRASPLDFCK